jgi:hypothetical protein
MASRLIRLGDAMSQLFNVLLFNGDPNHSISGDAYRFGRQRLQQFIDWLALPWEDEHCRQSYERDRVKAEQLLNEKPRTVTHGD